MKKLERVPLQIGWLSENNLLVKAGDILGYVVRIEKATSTGVPALALGRPVLTTSGTRKALEQFEMLWEDYLLFTVAQLLELDFEPGEFKYCECCKRLTVDLPATGEINA